MNPARRIVVLLVVLSCGAWGCDGKVGPFNPHEHPFLLHDGPVDDDATAETRALYINLKALSSTGILFGHQETTSYGVGWDLTDSDEDTRSDVESVCGDYPALYGWDIGVMTEGGNTEERKRKLIIEAYDRGGVNTISWHLDNPVSGGPYDDTTRAVDRILPGGDRHETYRDILHGVAAFVLSLRGSDGALVPIIFRPFHEHNGSWFWWGADHCTGDEFVALWRFTVEYLRDIQGVHNLLYAFSPDLFDHYDDYLHRYPGNDYVDILGHDNYWDLPSVVAIEQVVQMAEAYGKIAALTETGQEDPGSVWFTHTLLHPLLQSDLAARIAYVMVWRNADSGHHFAPYPGHRSVSDFLAFYADPATLFERDLPRDLYVLQ